MKTTSCFFFAILSIALLSCQSGTPVNEEAQLTSMTSDSVLFSFAFVGCNRINRGDRHNSHATDASTANVATLQRIYQDLSQLDNKPELFFFLGDMILGESDTSKMTKQLDAWCAMYEDTTFSDISTSGIEMVAVPGNHEMLKGTSSGEYPLGGSIDVWMKYMLPYLPNDRVGISTPDSFVNQATFAFVRHNTAFIVMNTDTYNEGPNGGTGTEGLIPTTWIESQIKQYRADTKIEHIFILGHKPCYVDGKFETGHGGLPEGPKLWPKLHDSHVIAMLSAHQHYYDRAQPLDTGTYQIIAGNGGSSISGGSTPPPFFGYSLINVMQDGRVELKSMGFDPAQIYYETPPVGPTTVRDSSTLTWSKNANPYQR